MSVFPLACPFLAIGDRECAQHQWLASYDKGTRGDAEKRNLCLDCDKGRDVLAQGRQAFLQKRREIMHQNIPKIFRKHRKPRIDASMTPAVVRAMERH